MTNCVTCGQKLKKHISLLDGINRAILLLILCAVAYIYVIGIEDFGHWMGWF